MNMKPLLILLMLAGLYFAIWISGDAGEAWSREKAEEMCTKTDVAAVYICLGNVVDVVWKDESKGSTFYKPDGNVVNCPPLSPSEMGAACMQLMMPNYCTLDDNVCGETPPEEFPGAKTEGELIYEGVPEEEEVPPEEEEVPPEEPVEIITPPPEEVPEKPGVTIEMPKKTIPVNTGEEGIDSLVLVVVVLAIIAIIFLYLTFRRTTSR